MEHHNFVIPVSKNSYTHWNLASWALTQLMEHHKWIKQSLRTIFWPKPFHYPSLTHYPNPLVYRRRSKWEHKFAIERKFSSSDTASWAKLQQSYVSCNRSFGLMRTGPKGPQVPTKRDECNWPLDKSSHTWFISWEICIPDDTWKRNTSHNFKNNYRKRPKFDTLLLSPRTIMEQSCHPNCTEWTNPQFNAVNNLTETLNAAGKM